MTKRTSITKALVEKLKTALDGTNYTSNIFNNAYPKIKFWDEVEDFPCIYVTPGSEAREYMPSDFTWGFLGISMKLYCHGEFAQEELEQLLQDVEDVIDANRVLVYDDTNNYETTEILLTSITTDEGLLAPYAIGEINLQVRYVVM
jgi:hypothetical protein